jgi:hypothetical protein
MSDQLPIRKYITVWIKNRKNPLRQDDSRTTSRTLEWVEYGQRQFMSLGKNATAAYARQAKADKEKELNDPGRRESLAPILWEDFRKAYLDTVYPGHDLPPKERKLASTKWSKSVKSMLGERRSLEDFGRIVMRVSDRQNTWCHDITSADQERFVSTRITEVNSGESVDADLRNLRTVFNVMEEWKHRPKASNPFAGRKKATIGTRRKRAKDVASGNNKKTEHYTRAEVAALLRQADREVKEQPDNWQRRRLRALVGHLSCT